MSEQPPIAEKDAGVDYYDGDADCGCSVVHPRWCFWNGPCCDHCSHEQHQCDDQTCVTSPAGDTDA